jgi:hypothetical protein
VVTDPHASTRNPSPRFHQATPIRSDRGTFPRPPWKNAQDDGEGPGHAVGVGGQQDSGWGAFETGRECVGSNQRIRPSASWVSTRLSTIYSTWDGI